jgi:acetyl-CoA carboxylase biotin carboxyl carrier protein
MLDKNTVIEFLKSFDASSAREFRLEDGPKRLFISKHGGTLGAGSEAGAGAPDPGVEAASTQIAPAQAAPAETDPGEVITSPVVATFYPAPGPDAPPFVRPGDRVRAGAPLCVLEAMKMMNQMEAEFDCEILEVLAGAGEIVEFGEGLFRVRRT